MVGENRTAGNQRDAGHHRSGLRIVRGNRGEDGRRPAYGASVTETPLHPESGWFCLNYDAKQRRERIPAITATHREDPEEVLADALGALATILLFLGLAFCYIALAFAAVDLPLPGQ